VPWAGRSESDHQRDQIEREGGDPRIEAPTDAVIRVTSTAICGSDLHLYEVLGAFMTEGDVLGHEPMGIVEAVGADVTHIAPGDRVVIPFNISCGHCWTCDHGLQSQCETTQVREYGTGAALLGYSKLYGQVPGGQAEYLRVPHADYGPIRVPHDGPDERFLFLSDVLPTAWQAVQYAELPQHGTVVVLGLGPIGQMSSRIARHLGHRVIGIDLVPERLAVAARHDIETLDLTDIDDLGAAVRDLTDGRGPDSVIDAVGMEAHGSGGAKMLQSLVGLLPDAVAQPIMEKGGLDRLAAFHEAIDIVRRGGTISLSGVYGGSADPLPMLQLKPHTPTKYSRRRRTKPSRSSSNQPPDKAWLRATTTHSGLGLRTRPVLLTGDGVEERLRVVDCRRHRGGARQRSIATLVGSVCWCGVSGRHVKSFPGGSLPTVAPVGAGFELGQSGSPFESFDSSHRTAASHVASTISAGDPVRSRQRVMIESSMSSAIHTVPGGTPSWSSGPATPVTAIAIPASRTRHAPSAMAVAASCETTGTGGTSRTSRFTPAE
jgi:threonine dehydrogenase-like Zn-dependent dehydrogenase